VSSVSTLKPLQFQYSLYRFIAYYSIAHSAAPTKVLPGADRPPLATPLVGSLSEMKSRIDPIQLSAYQQCCSLVPVKRYRITNLITKKVVAHIT